MRKHIILAIALLASCCLASAQQTWFPTKVGTNLVYSDLDRKGKTTDQFAYTVTDVTKDSGKTTIAYEITSMDGKGMPTGMVVPGKVWSAEGYFHTDVKASLTGLVNLDAVTIKGHAPIVPENPKNGETLDNCSATIESLMVEFQWNNLKITTGQSVTTPAGTFDDAMVLEYDTFSKIAIIKVNQKMKEWYVKGIGVVRSEMYSNKGQLSQSRELISIED